MASWSELEFVPSHVDITIHPTRGLSMDEMINRIIQRTAEAEKAFEDLSNKMGALGEAVNVDP